jgi:F0F1-type ATP synthase assembly protein I
MNNINLGRVVLGGLLAGLVLNVGEFLLNDQVLGAQMKDFMTKHNFAEPSSSFMIVAVGLTFVMGIVIVLGYACIRPRLGAGVKTAIIAGLFAWFGVYFYSGIINGVLFGIPTNTMIMVVVWGLIQYALAAVAGAWVYKEA